MCWVTVGSVNHTSPLTSPCGVPQPRASAASCFRASTCQGGMVRSRGLVVTKRSLRVPWLLKHWQALSLPTTHPALAPSHTCQPTPLGRLTWFCSSTTWRTASSFWTTMELRSSDSRTSASSASLACGEGWGNVDGNCQRKMVRCAKHTPTDRHSSYLGGRLGLHGRHLVTQGSQRCRLRSGIRGQLHSLLAGRGQLLLQLRALALQASNLVGQLCSAALCLLLARLHLGGHRLGLQAGERVESRVAWRSSCLCGHE